MARILAEAGQPEPALTATRAITDPDRQADALAEVARGLAKAGQPEQAKYLRYAIAASVGQEPVDFSHRAGASA